MEDSFSRILESCSFKYDVPNSDDDEEKKISNLFLLLEQNAAGR